LKILAAFAAWQLWAESVCVVRLIRSSIRHVTPAYLSYKSLETSNLTGAGVRPPVCRQAGVQSAAIGLQNPMAIRQTAINNLRRQFGEAYDVKKVRNN